MKVKLILFISLFFFNQLKSQIRTIDWKGYYTGIYFGPVLTDITSQSNIEFINNLSLGSEVTKEDLMNYQYGSNYFSSGLIVGVQTALASNKNRTNHLQFDLSVLVNLNQIDIDGLEIKNNVTKKFYLIESQQTKLLTNIYYLFTTKKTAYNTSSAFFGVGPGLGFDLFSSVNQFYNESISENGFSSSVSLTRPIGNVKKEIYANVGFKVGFETSIIRKLHFAFESGYRTGFGYHIGGEFNRVGYLNLAIGLRYYFAKFAVLKKGPCPTFR